MKAERRHELRENDLVHALSSARDYFDKNGGRLGLVVIAVIAVVGVATFTMRSRAAALEDTFRQRTNLSFEDPETGLASLEKLKEMASTTSDAGFAMTAWLDRGAQALRLTREAPAPPDPKFNGVAEDSFQQLLQRYPDNPLAAGVALSGLATVEENRFLSTGDLKHKETARQFLQRIVDHPRLAGLPFQQNAMDRLSRIDQVFVKVELAIPKPPAETGNVDLADPAAPVEPSGQ